MLLNRSEVFFDSTTLLFFLHCVKWFKFCLSHEEDSEDGVGCHTNIKTSEKYYTGEFESATPKSKRPKNTKRVNLKIRLGHLAPFFRAY